MPLTLGRPDLVFGFFYRYIYGMCYDGMVAMTGNTEMEQEMKDPIFEEEQAHLHTTYRTLCEMKTDLEDKLQKLEQQAAEEKNDIRDNLRLDTADDEVLMESYAEMGTWNRYVDSMNVTSDLLTHRLKNLDVLLRHPTLRGSPYGFHRKKRRKTIISALLPCQKTAWIR